jgi:23S rRNA (pseudouridine1915-N3)-methyltransferase
MKLKFIFLGKKMSEPIDAMIINYLKRLNVYVKSDYLYLQEKNQAKLEQKILSTIKPNTCLIILDENGKSLNTVEYTQFIEDKISRYSSILFVVGDAYGIPNKILNSSNYLIALSKMTFPHLLARLILVEQTYRSFTIFNNHPYHHE